MHETGIHGGLPTKPTAIFFATAALLGAIVLAAEAIGGDEGGGHGKTTERSHHQ